MANDTRPRDPVTGAFVRHPDKPAKKRASTGDPRADLALIAAARTWDAINTPIYSFEEHDMSKKDRLLISGFAITPLAIIAVGGIMLAWATQRWILAKIEDNQIDPAAGVEGIVGIIQGIAGMGGLGPGPSAASKVMDLLGIN